MLRALNMVTGLRRLELQSAASRSKADPTYIMLVEFKPSIGCSVYTCKLVGKPVPCGALYDEPGIITAWL